MIVGAVQLERGERAGRDAIVVKNEPAFFGSGFVAVYAVIMDLAIDNDIARIVRRASGRVHRVQDLGDKIGVR